jgi:two-component system OmpR family sensor kinase
MGRLFWKFFISILLAQLAATVGIGGAFWLRDQARERAATPSIDTSPSAETMLDAASATLKHGGTAALRELAAGSTRRTIFIIDAEGRDLLGREVSASLQQEAQTSLTLDGPQGARQLRAPDGQQYLVFVRWNGEHGRGGWRGGMPPGAASGGGASPRSTEGGVAVASAQHDAAYPRNRLARAPNDGPGGPNGRGPGGTNGPGGPNGPVAERFFHPLIPMLAATLASLLFAALLAWYFSRPIRALRSAFEAASAGDLAPRFGVAGGVRGDELSDLGRDFDRMSAQLRALMDGQRRLLHDVSHELRSPLARLQAAIGLAHQQPDKLAASLVRIERESVRMDKLIGELLTLSRLEASSALPMNDSIDIMEMAEEIAADARFEAGPEGCDVAVRGGAIVQMRGSADLLWRALENVVRNAVHHGGAGGDVEIYLGAAPDWVHIDVADRGPGIADADMKAIFEPFFRSNAEHHRVDGHGLGLAIAQRVVQAHGGTISAHNRDGGGLCVEIALPLA